MGEQWQMLRKAGWNHCGEPRTPSSVFQTLDLQRLFEKESVTKLTFCENGSGDWKKKRKGNSLKAGRPIRG